MKISILSVLTATVAVIFVLCSCSEFAVAPDNGISGEDGEGIHELSLKLPKYESYNVLLGSSTVVAELVGESDHVTHYLTLLLDPAGEYINISSVDESLKSFPHQRYYLNHLFYSNSSISEDDIKDCVEELITKGSANDINSIGVGAIISVEDPNNIHLVSSVNLGAQTYGSGEDEDPILIYSFSSFKTNIMEGVARSTSSLACTDNYYLQTANIDLSSWYADYDWAPIGEKNAQGDPVWFNGLYDGGNFAITSLYASSDGAMGLFWGLGHCAIVKNLSILGCNLRGGDYVGTIACKASNYSAIDQVIVEGIIYGNNHVGGFVGAYITSPSTSADSQEYYKYNIQNSIFSGKVSIEEEENSNSEVQYGCGGFVGSSIEREISLDHVSFCGSIESDDDAKFSGIGGIVGLIRDQSGEDYTANLDITYAAFAGTISVEADSVGGIVGTIDSPNSCIDIKQCFLGAIWVKNSADTSMTVLGDNPQLIPNSMTINGKGDFVGGTIGFANTDNYSIWNIQDNYLISVTGNNYVGLVFGAIDMTYTGYDPYLDISGTFYGRVKGISNVGMIGRVSVSDKPLLKTVTIGNSCFNNFGSISGSAEDSDESPSAIGGFVGSAYNLKVNLFGINIDADISGDGAQEEAGYLYNSELIYESYI